MTNTKPLRTPPYFECAARLRGLPFSVPGGLTSMGGMSASFLISAADGLRGYWAAGIFIVCALLPLWLVVGRYICRNVAGGDMPIL